MDVSVDALRPSEESFTLGRSLAVELDAPVDDRHISPLAYVPVGNLRQFKQRGGKILFATSYLAAVDSDYANARRAYPLSDQSRAMYIDFDRPSPPVYGLYDPPLDALVFSSALTPINHERVVLHEFGHAMTSWDWSGRAHLRGDLLLGLPEQIYEVLRNYPGGDRPQDISVRVLEALAEAYTWALLGRFDELPRRLSGIVHGVLAGDALRPTG